MAATASGAAAAPSSSALAAMSRYGALSAGRATPATAAQKAKATAEEFEAVFLSSMFNQMFAGLTGDGPFGGKGAAGTWRSFLADEYARSFAKAGGVGIGAQVYRSLLSVQEAASR
jgi:flagellar protein FlgJ